MLSMHQFISSIPCVMIRVKMIDKTSKKYAISISVNKSVNGDEKFSRERAFVISITIIVGYNANENILAKFCCENIGKLVGKLSNFFGKESNVSRTGKIIEIQKIYNLDAFTRVFEDIIEMCGDPYPERTYRIQEIEELLAQGDTWQRMHGNECNATCFCGRSIMREDYGKKDVPSGWEMCHEKSDVNEGRNSYSDVTIKCWWCKSLRDKDVLREC